jgi:MYXO-CTERM domain-containing protein
MGNFAWWLGAAGALGACSGPTSSGELARVSGSLKMAIGDEIGIGTPYSELAESGDRSVMACGSTECVVAYLDDLGDSEGPVHLLATRIAADGSVLDVPAIHLAEGVRSIYLTIGSDGAGSYLVTWDDVSLREDPADDTGTHAVQLNAADLTVQDFGTIFSDSGYGRPRGIYSNGESFLLTYTSSSEQKYRLLKDGVVGAEEALSFPVSDAAVGPGQYCLVGEEMAQRIDAATGEPIDIAPIVLTKYLDYPPDGDTHAAYVDETYVNAWADHSHIFTIRVRASDGVVLDPDDDFNEFSGAHDVCNSCVPSGGRMVNVLGVTAKGAEAIVTYAYEPYSYSTSTVNALRLDPASGELADPTLYTLCQVYQGDYYSFALNDSMGGCMSQPHVQTLTYDAGPFGIFASSSTLYSSTAGVDSNPVVASNGVDFAVAWEFCPTSGHCSVKATRVSGVSGNVLDDPPIEVASAGSGVSAMTIAGHPGGYVIAWSADTSDDAFWACALSSEGVAGVPLELVGGLQDEAHSACNSDRCALSRQVAQSSPIVHRVDLAVTQEVEHYRLRPDAGGYSALVSDTEPAPELRTFMSFWNTSGTVFGARVRSATGAELDDTTIATEAAKTSPVLAASDGARFRVAWLNSAGSLRATDVDPVSGESVEAIRHELGTAPDGMTAHRIWYDGVSYAVLFSSAAGIAVARVARDFAPLDGPSVADAATVAVELRGTPDAAASTGGRSLLVYVTDEYAPVGRRVRGRFLDNDGRLAPPASPGGGQGGQGEGGGTDGQTGGHAQGGQGDGGGINGQTGGHAQGGQGGDGAGIGQAGKDTRVGQAGHVAHDGQAGDGMVSVAGNEGGGASNAGPDAEPSEGAGHANGPTSAGSAAVDSAYSAGDHSGGGTTSAEGGEGGSVGLEGTPTNAHADDGGCGCRIARGPSSNRAPMLALLLGAALGRRIRRRASLRNTGTD